MAEINVDGLESNSIESRKEPPERKVERIVTKKVRKRRKTLGERVSEAMLGDSPGSVRSYLVWDVLLPAVKDTISELVKKGIDALLFGDSKPRDNVRRKGDRSYIQYDRPSYLSEERRASRVRTVSRRSSHSFDDILIPDRQEAEEVLDALNDLTMQYGMATLSDFYELVGMAHTYVDGEYGWYELGSASVKRTRGGYVLDLPRPERIEDDW